MGRTGDTNVYLDVTHIPLRHLRKRFPTIAKLCVRFDIDPARDMIPVRPSAHYFIGGVQTNRDGRAMLPGLFACGEVASSGLHGANRLGSNSLLEGLVMGARAGKLAGELASREADREHPRFLTFKVEPDDSTAIDLDDVSNSLKSLMWRNVGLVRDAPKLQEAMDRMRFWSCYIMAKEFHGTDGWQLQNMLTVARLIVAQAHEREESRGVHYRIDFPETDDEHWLKHSMVSRHE